MYTDVHQTEVNRKTTPPQNTHPGVKGAQRFCLSFYKVYDKKKQCANRTRTRARTQATTIHGLYLALLSLA